MLTFPLRTRLRQFDSYDVIAFRLHRRQTPRSRHSFGCMYTSAGRIHQYKHAHNFLENILYTINFEYRSFEVNFQLKGKVVEEKLMEYFQ